MYKNIYVTVNTKSLSLYKIYENQMIFLEKTKINVQNPSYSWDLKNP